MGLRGRSCVNHMNRFEKEYYEYDEFWTSEKFNEANLERIQLTADQIPADTKTILDVACGNGLFCNFLKQSKADVYVVGLDRSSSALRHVNTKKILGDITHLPFENEAFDCLSALEVMEHLPITDYELAKGELCRVAKKNIIVSVPNEQLLVSDMTQCPECKSIFNPDLHLRSFTEQFLKSIFAENGFECVSTRRMGAYEKFIGHERYRDVFRPYDKLIWRSPICVVCGYQEKPKTPDPLPLPIESSISWRKIVRKYWPKKIHYSWLLALYQKTNR